MKKLLIISLSICFVMVMTAFLLPSIKSVSLLPDEMIVTYQDVHQSNETNAYGSFINLELPKDIDVANNGELTNTTLNVKLFNFFTIN